MNILHRSELGFLLINRNAFKNYAKDMIVADRGTSGAMSERRNEYMESFINFKGEKTEEVTKKVDTNQILSILHNTIIKSLNEVPIIQSDLDAQLKEVSIYVENESKKADQSKYKFDSSHKRRVELMKQKLTIFNKFIVSFAQLMNTNLHVINSFLDAVKDA